MKPIAVMRARGATGGGAGDPYWANAVSLSHFDGAAGSTIFTDRKGRTWAAGGNAQISTAQSKFGASSLLLDGSGDFISTADHADLRFGASDFTIELFARMLAVTGERGLVSKYSSANIGLNIRYSASNGGIRSVFGTNSGAVDAFNSVWTPASNTWYHLAFCRAGNTYRVFVDGVVIGVHTLVNVATPNGIGSESSDLRVGQSQTVASSDFHGYIDELRITKGIARYTANFTPPAAPFPDS